MTHYPTTPLPTQPAPSRNRRSRPWLIVGIVVFVVIAVLVIGDRVASAYTENRIGQEIKDQGFNTKPNVSIQGFPFLTQLAGRDFHDVNISADKVSEGPVDIRGLNATLHGVRLNSSFNGGTVEHLSGTALITFGDLFGSAGGPSVRVTSVTGDKVRFTVDLDVVSGSGIARVTQVGKNKVHVRVISTGDIPLDVLGPLTDFTLSLPSLPMGMSLQNVSVSRQGVRIHIVGTNVAFSQ